MSLYIRRFLSDPGADVLLEIESVNILDLEPPSSITGVGTGAAMIVGEFANGPFKSPTEVSSADDLLNFFGGLGYTRSGIGGYDPSARVRFADSAIVGENWNGNGFVQLSGKKFKRLIIVRVDTSIGSVQFTRQAYLTGAASFAYALTSGQVLQLDAGAGNASATFTGTAATVEGAAVTNPSTFAGGETVVLGFDDATAHPNFTVTFLAADQTPAQVVARINTYAGFTFATVTSGGTKITLTGRQLGTGGQVRVVSGSSGVLTKLGLTAANTAGGGNVANIAAVTAAEVKTIVEAAVAGTTVETDSSGHLRISAASTLTVGASTTASALGFAVGATDLASAGNAGVIPAGTVITNSGVTVSVVTMQDIVVTSASAGPYVVKVRHATDDGTGLTAGAGTMTKVPTPIDIDSFTVTNPQVLSAALSEAAIDAAYLDAIDSTSDISSVAAEANIFWSARQSNQIRRALKQNSIDASANGCVGRMAPVRPPLGTLKAVALSTAAEPGIGAYRDQRVIYCYPGANTFVPAIAKRGTAGGTGFTASGNVDVGSDGFMASVLSQLAPEENPGQATTFMVAVNSIESTLSTQVLTIVDYKNFKAKGIAGLRIAAGTPVFQSGVTSVDPLANPGLVRISRRRMADFCEDSMARRAVGFGKKLSTAQRRKAFENEIRDFLATLLGKQNPGSQRIAGFTVKVVNDAVLLARGLFRMNVTIRTLASLDSIVLAVTVGESVDVDEVLPAAA